MRPRDAAELLLLAALWGASFLFTRIAAPAVGPAALAFLRCAGAALLLLPLLAGRGQIGALRRHWRAIALVGLVNSALPFLLFAAAALALTAGLTSIFNATAPLWAGLIAVVWLGERPTAARWAGQAIGFAGVVGLGLHDAGMQGGTGGITPGLAVAACVLGTFFYGLGANIAKVRLAGIPPLAVAAGSQLAAALLMLAPALWWWPQQPLPATVWGAVAALAFACTGCAYLLYFRLIANIGPTNAIAVTFLIPAFALLWGALVLGEAVTPALLAGCAAIVCGTALATGLLAPRRAAASSGCSLSGSPPEDSSL